MTEKPLELDRIGNVIASFKIIGLIMVIYLLISFISPSSDNIGVFVIPLAAVTFYGPLICLFACFRQAGKLIKTLPKEGQKEVSLFRLTMTGMPSLFLITGFCSLAAMLVSPFVFRIFMLAPVWVFYGLAPF